MRSVSFVFCAVRSPSFFWLREDLLAGLVPAHVELALVLGRCSSGGAWCGRVHRARGPQHHERVVGLQRLVAGDPLDGAVGQVLVEVVGLAVRLGVVVVPHDRHELVHVSRHEAVGVVEALTARPAVERADLGDLVERRVVPLAQRVVDVACLTEVVGHRSCRTAGPSRCSRGTPSRSASGCRGRSCAGCDRPSASRAIGEQSAVVWKLLKRKPVFGETIDVRRVDQPAKLPTELPEPDVVEQEDDHVGRIGMGADWARATTPQTPRSCGQSCRQILRLLSF